ncbi:hypothetical protein T4B_11934 [Trichinella pseudospiralis]|uniref:Uncharacterized protein n=1 Tax=Trichinella pseudospiralis TaxID=6337 RepID=A0A0V1E518_TRIPS|nr:hypothetical protein T4A_11911 [Trichinella pseudospiralis]KRZ27177.1 hypothetical protein T4B_11934 [Trichinella pseudospiralis]
MPIYSSSTFAAVLCEQGNKCVKQCVYTVKALTPSPTLSHSLSRLTYVPSLLWHRSAFHAFSIGSSLPSVRPLRRCEVLL